VHVVVVVSVVVALHEVTVVLHVVHATRSGKACAMTEFRSPAMLSNPFPTTCFAPAIMELAFATSEAAMR